MIILVCNTLQMTFIFPHQEGWERIVSLGFFIGAFVILNSMFINDVIRIFNSGQKIEELYKEYVWVFITALINIFLFSTIYYLFGINSGQDIIKNDWVTSIYFSIVTWTTLGYGDLAPVYNLRLVASFEAFIGYLYMALLVGLLLNIGQHTMRPKE